MKKENSESSGCLLIFVLMPFASAYGAVLGGYAISTLWRWFVVPTFGLKPLSVALAAGLMLIPLYFRLGVMVNQPKDETPAWDILKDWPRRLIVWTLLIGTLLLEGYVIHRWFV